MDGYVYKIAVIFPLYTYFENFLKQVEQLAVVKVTHASHYDISVAMVAR